MPNAIAQLALVAWPVVSIWLFTRYRADRAFIASILIAYLFLPEPPAMYDFPLLPALDKHTIPALTAFAILLWRHDGDAPLLPQSRFGKALVALYVLSPAVTSVLNTDPVFFGSVGLPGMGIKDAGSVVIGQFLLILPFLMARRLLASGGSQRDILVALLAGGLVYSLLMLIEIRLSPQLNLWIYGYYQHSFAQSVRAGGFRPVVFLNHGLWVAFFCMTAVVSAWALWRRGEMRGTVWLWLAALYLTAVMVLAKSLGALIFTALLVPMVLILAPRLQVTVALALALMAAIYPVAKAMDLAQEDRFIAAAAQIDTARAASLQFRFDNETTLMERALERPIFGWGNWGRNHILHPETGVIETVTDGRWIILIGTYGWVGYVAEFGLLLLPLLLLFWESWKRPKADAAPYIGALSLVLGINIVDLLPNATLTPLTWLVAGALLGHAELLRRERFKQSLTKRVRFAWRPIL